MKKVTFIRHAKSSWDFAVSDLDRPLKERGISDAHRIGKHLKKRSFQVEKAFSSPANRALHTCVIVLTEMDFDFNYFQLSNDLYDFSGAQVADFLKGLDNDLQSVLIFGHNHAFTSLVNIFGNVPIENIPTAGVVTIAFEATAWADLSMGKTIFKVFPRELKQ